MGHPGAGQEGVETEVGMAQELVKDADFRGRGDVVRLGRPHEREHQPEPGEAQDESGAFCPGLRQHGDQGQDDPGPEHGRDGDEGQVEQGDLEVKRRADLVDLSERGHHRSGKEDQRPTGHADALQELPAVDVLVGDGQGQEPVGFAVLEERAVADDEVREDQHHEEEAEEEVEDALGEQRADGRERVDEVQALVKKEVTQQQITHDEGDEQGGQNGRAFAQGPHAGQQAAPMYPEQQAEETEGAHGDSGYSIRDGPGKQAGNRSVAAEGGIFPERRHSACFA